MIAELEELAPEERHLVLNRIAATLLPNAGVETSRVVVNDSRTDRIIAALRNRFGESQALANDAKLYSVVAEELSKRYLTDARVSEIRHRLGNRAELDPSQSEVVLGTDTQETKKLFAIRDKDIKNALHHPDRVQRILPSDLGLSKARFPAMSFRLTRHRGGSGDAYWLLLHCMHEKDKITVWQAFRVYDSDVQISPESLPLEIFRAFIEVYGTNLILDGLPLSKKLILYEVIRLKQSNSFTLTGDVLRGEPTSKVLLVKFGELGTAEIAFAHVFKIRKYVEDLERHGLPVKPSAILWGQHEPRSYHQVFEDPSQSQ